AQVLVGQPLALALHQLPHLVQDPVELGLVAGVRRGLGLLVEGVQLPEQVVARAELPFAHQPDDHGFSSSSFWAPPAASSPFSFASSSSTWLCVEICASSRSSDVSPEVKSSSVPDSTSSSTAAARACMSSVLSCARWMARPVSAISSP